MFPVNKNMWFKSKRCCSKAKYELLMRFDLKQFPKHNKITCVCNNERTLNE